MSVRRIYRLKNAADNKSLTIPHFYYTMGKNSTTDVIQCDIYNLYKCPLVVDTKQYLKKSPKLKRTRAKTIL